MLDDQGELFRKTLICRAARESFGMQVRVNYGVFWPRMLGLSWLRPLRDGDVSQ